MACPGGQDIMPAVGLDRGARAQRVEQREAQRTVADVRVRAMRCETEAVTRCGRFSEGCRVGLVVMISLFGRF